MNTKSLLIPKLLYSLLLIGNIILILLINSNLTLTPKKTFITIFILYIFIMLIYIPKAILKNVKVKKAVYIKTALKKFILFLVITITFYYTVNSIFNRFTIVQILIKCFTISFTLSFMDITFIEQ